MEEAANGLPAEYAKADVKVVGRRWKQVTAGYDGSRKHTRVCVAVTAHLPGTLFPSGVRIRRAAPLRAGLRLAGLLACTYLTVGHVLAQSRAVGLHAVAGLEVGVLRRGVVDVGHGCDVWWSRAHVRGGGGSLGSWWRARN